MKKYDPVLCMMVEDEAVKTCDAAFQKGKKYWSDRFHRYVYFVEIDGSGRYIFEDIAGAKLAFGANEVNGIKVRDGKPYVKYVDLKSDNGKEIKKEFNTTEEAKRFIEKNDEKTIIVKASGNFDSSSVKDEQKVIKSKNGYTLGINNGKLVLAFTYKGETLNNPHMWLGEASNESNYNKAIKLFEEFAKIKHNDSLDRAIKNCENK